MRNKSAPVGGKRSKPRGTVSVYRHFFATLGVVGWLIPLTQVRLYIVAMPV